jgi:hypothetical protein
VDVKEIDMMWGEVQAMSVEVIVRIRKVETRWDDVERKTHRGTNEIPWCTKKGMVV